MCCCLSCQEPSRNCHHRGVPHELHGADGAPALRACQLTLGERVVPRCTAASVRSEPRAVQASSSRFGVTAA